MQAYKTATWILVGILAILVAGVLLNKGCNSIIYTKPDSTIIQGPTTIIKKDSVTIRQQQVVILQSQQQVQALEDSVEKLTYALSGVQPSYIVRYADTLKLHDSIPYVKISTQDSLLIDSLTKASTQYANLLRHVSYKGLMPIPRDFYDSGTFFKIKGTVTGQGVVVKDLQIPSTTSVIIGQKSSLFSTGPITVNVAESNPLISPGPMQTYYYKPKEKRWTLVAGPAILFDGKSFHQGVALTAGYRVW